MEYLNHLRAFFVPPKNRPVDAIPPSYYAHIDKNAPVPKGAVQIPRNKMLEMLYAEVKERGYNRLYYANHIAAGYGALTAFTLIAGMRTHFMLVRGTGIIMPLYCGFLSGGQILMVRPRIISENYILGRVEDNFNFLALKNIMLQLYGGVLFPMVAGSFACLYTSRKHVYDDVKPATRLPAGTNLFHRLKTLNRPFVAIIILGTIGLAYALQYRELQDSQQFLQELRACQISNKNEAQ